MPFVMVNPDRVESLGSCTQGVAAPPSMIVNSGPLTLTSVRGFVTVIEEYTPFVTKTLSPVELALTAS
jgi:hypothetical protein